MKRTMVDVEVDSEWEARPLGDVIDIFDSQRVPLNSGERHERQGPYPYYGAQGVIDHVDDFLFNGRYILVAEDGENLNSKKLPLALIAEGKFWVNNHAHIIRGKEGVVDDIFLHACLNWVDIKPFITGAAQPKLSQGNLRLIEIPVPNLITQRRIAGILSAYDELIANNQRRIAVLEQMARALYREWFVYFRAPGGVMNEGDEVPEGWTIELIESLVKRISVGKRFDQRTVSETGAVPVLDQGKTGVIGYHDEVPGVNASPANPVIVFANHTCYQRLIHFPFSAIQNVLPIVTKPERDHNIYWLHWTIMGRVAFNDYKGHWPELIAKEVAVPPKGLCQRFGQMVAPMHLHILNLERATENLRRTRDLLLPRLMSGRVEVTPT